MNTKQCTAPESVLYLMVERGEKDWQIQQGWKKKMRVEEKKQNWKVEWGKKEKTIAYLQVK